MPADDGELDGPLEDVLFPGDRPGLQDQVGPVGGVAADR
jgi:hypothetical protein